MLKWHYIKFWTDHCIQFFKTWSKTKYSLNLNFFFILFFSPVYFKPLQDVLLNDRSFNNRDPTGIFSCLTVETRNFCNTIHGIWNTILPTTKQRAQSDVTENIFFHILNKLYLRINCREMLAFCIDQTGNDSIFETNMRCTNDISNMVSYTQICIIICLISC